MTDNEIKKALECCCKNNNCEGCPLDYLTFSSQCASELAIKSLDLINRLQAEKEALINGQETLQKYLAEQKAENDTLKNVIKNSFLEKAGLDIDPLAEIKAEAYKEFADLSIKRICEEVSAPTPSESYIVEKCNLTIDNLSQELVGE